MFVKNRFLRTAPKNISELKQHALHLLYEPDLEVSEVKPFIWSLIEAYVDRFDRFPFDAKRLLFCCLELREFPEEEVKALVRQLELHFEEYHGRPLHTSTRLVSRHDALDDEIRKLRDTLKYAAVVGDMPDEDDE